MVAIELFKQKQERLIKRPMPVHSKYIVHKFIDQHMPIKNIQINRVDTSPTLDHIINIRASYFENISYSSNEVISFTNNITTASIIRPERTYLQRIGVRPQIKSIPNSNGDKFIIDKLPELAKPDMRALFIQKDNRSLRKYLEMIRKRIEDNKKYPLLAINYSIEGRSGVKFTILANGKLENVEIIDSSGVEVLDQAALDSVYNSAPFPSIPSDTELDKIEVVVYIVFKISQFGKL